VWTPVRQPDLLKRPEARRCGECHQEIFEAWKKSRHSLAWVSKNYIKDSEKRTKEKCLACHIPTTVHAGEKPEPRLDRRNEGIYCVPCHVKDGAMHGPHKLVAPPHPTQYNQDYNASKMCGSCHEKTFKEWKATGERDTCQSCHMPRKRMRLTQKAPLSLLHNERWVGDHRFLHGDFEPDTLKETALPWRKPVSYNYRVPEEAVRATLHLLYRPAWSKEKESILTREAPRQGTG
jgi:hypothetical protein